MCAWMNSALHSVAKSMQSKQAKLELLQLSGHDTHDKAICQPLVQQFTKKADT